jgi:hypothetical protein
MLYPRTKIWSEFRTCLELGAICIEVGLPPGVLNIITGLGTEAGAPLSSHPHVDKVRPLSQWVYTHMLMDIAYLT